MAVKPETSTKSTVTSLRSPSRAAFEVRIFSARCFGVYESGVANLAVGVVRSGEAHWPQNLLSAGFAAPQDGQVAASGAAHSQLHAWGILVLAPGTLHAAPPSEPGGN